MTQIQLFQLQAERINAIIKNDIDTIDSVALNPIQSIDKLPIAMLSIDGAPAYANDSAATWDIVTDWTIRLYISEIGENTFAAQVNVYSYADQLANAFISRAKLQLNDNGLNYCKDTQFEFTQGFSQLLRYPLSGGKQYAGVQARLRVFSFVNIKQSS